MFPLRLRAGCRWLWRLSLVRIVGALPGFLRKPKEKPWRLHVEDQGRTGLKALGAEAVSWSVLPHVAHSNLDAIVRTLHRLHISRRQLLEWTTASDSEARRRRAAAITAPQCGLALQPVRRWRPGWPRQIRKRCCLLAPRWARGWRGHWRHGGFRGRGAGPVRLAEPQIRQFRRWARQTWHYFEEMVGEEDHWLPPDNLQEHPHWMVAHRTSPTNIGMGLLADLAAHDLGYVSTAALLARTGRTLHTLGQLERHRGHFFNWYDTHTLQPAEPRYVSSVDSGNLWAPFTALQTGLKELRHRPLVPPRFLQGLSDTLDVIASLRPSSNSSAAKDRFDACLAELRVECAGAAPGGVRRACRLLRRICAWRRPCPSPRPMSLPTCGGGRLPWCDSPRRCAETLRDWLLDCAREACRPRNDATFALAPRSKRVGRQEERPPERLRRFPSFDSPHRQQRSGATGDGPIVDGSCGAGGAIGVRGIASLPRRIGPRVQSATVGLHGRTCGRPHHAVVRACGGRRRGLLRPAAPDAGLLRCAARGAASAARKQLRQIAVLARFCRNFAAMDFRFLYHAERRLLAIGYNVSQQRRDDNYYGMLASEARLASFLAVSHGQLPLEHWFALGRMITLADAKPMLLSWSGSMFEYLMPMLLMPSFRNTLLDASCRRAVRRQIRYARQRRVPWGSPKAAAA